MIMSLSLAQQDRPARPAHGESAQAKPRISTRSLMGSGNLLLIDHAGMQYTLRITRTGKLILTK